jgi:hypothetical protein
VHRRDGGQLTVPPPGQVEQGQRVVDAAVGVDDDVADLAPWFGREPLLTPRVP